jgi:outer membrane protein assembly factor BamA
MAIAVVVLLTFLELAQPPGPDRVGQIIIEGNDSVPDRVILGQLSVFPGQVLRYPGLKETEARLAGSGLFEPGGVIVAVEPGEPKSAFRDVRISVQERSWVPLFFAVWEGVRSQLGNTDR